MWSTVSYAVEKSRKKGSNLFKKQRPIFEWYVNKWDCHFMHSNTFDIYYNK